MSATKRQFLWIIIPIGALALCELLNFIFSSFGLFGDPENPTSFEMILIAPKVILWPLASACFILLIAFLWGLVGMYFRGCSSPILYVFAILPIIPVTIFAVDYRIKTPLGAFFSVLGKTLLLYFLYMPIPCLYIPGVIYAWTHISRNQRRKERIEEAELQTEALKNAIKMV